MGPTYPKHTPNMNPTKAQHRIYIYILFFWNFKANTPVRAVVVQGLANVCKCLLWGIGFTSSHITFKYLSICWKIISPVRWCLIGTWTTPCFGKVPVQFPAVGFWFPGVALLSAAVAFTSRFAWSDQGPRRFRGWRNHHQKNLSDKTGF